MQKGAKRTRLIIYLLYLVIATAAVSSVTLARYASTGSGLVTVQVASFAVGGTSQFDVLLEEGLIPGDEKTVQFTVTNFEDDAGCDVDLEYNVEVRTTGNLPLQFSLIGSGNGDAENDTLVAALTENEENVWTAQGGRLPYVVNDEDKRTHSYELVITWPADKSDGDYSYEIDALQVTINAVQRDPTAQ